MTHCFEDYGVQPARSIKQAALLTRAQLAVVGLVADGLSNKKIAVRLGVGEATVKAHVREAAGRLGFSNRVQLAVWYVKADGASNSRWA